MTQAEINIDLLQILKICEGYPLVEERLREHADLRIRPRATDQQIQLALTTIKDHGFADFEEDPLMGKKWYLTEKGRVYLKA